MSSSETAGLGKNASKESFRSQFEGLGKTVTVKKSAPKKENNEIQALSGATITSNAVADGANAALENIIRIQKDRLSDQKELQALWAKVDKLLK